MLSLEQELQKLSIYAISRQWTQYLLQLYNVSNKFKLSDKRFSNHFLLASLYENFDKAILSWKADSTISKIAKQIKENNFDEIAALKSKIDLDYDSDTLPDNCFTLLIGNHNLPKGKWKLPDERTFLWSPLNNQVYKFTKPIYKEGLPQGNAKIVLLQKAYQDFSERDTISEEITKYYILKRLKHYDVKKTILLGDTQFIENVNILSKEFYKDLIIQIIQNILDGTLTFDKLIIVSENDNKKKYLKLFLQDLYDFITFNADIEHKLKQLISQTSIDDIKYTPDLKIPEEPAIRFRKMFSPNCSQLDVIFNYLYQIKDTSESILLLGESGVGKDVLAHLIHNESNRNKTHDGFQELNCASVSKELLEAKLFGHEKGAFTDAKEMREGLFELAHRGTLFLDEIGDATPEVQTALLKVLENKKIRRVGGRKDIVVDVRVIFATNQNLENLVSDGKFRKDLYYRIKKHTINIPPLKKRLEDIPYIVDLRKAEYEKTYNTKLDISESFINSLKELNWSGNIRELINFVDRVFILAPGDNIKKIGDELVLQEILSSPEVMMDFNLIKYEDLTYEFFRTWLNQRERISNELRRIPELEDEKPDSNLLSFGRSIIEPILANIYAENWKSLGIQSQKKAGETIGLTWAGKEGTLLQRHKLYPIVKKFFG